MSDTEPAETAEDVALIARRAHQGCRSGSAHDEVAAAVARVRAALAAPVPAVPAEPPPIVGVCNHCGGWADHTTSFHPVPAVPAEPAPPDPCDYGPPPGPDGDDSGPDEVHCRRCGVLAIDHLPGHWSIYGLCPDLAALAAPAPPAETWEAAALREAADALAAAGVPTDRSYRDEIVEWLRDRAAALATPAPTEGETAT